MPMLMMLRICLPVWPFQAPERILLARSAIRSRNSCTWATTSTPVDHQRGPLRHAQRYVQHRTFLGNVDPLPCEHHVAALLEFGLLTQLEQQCHGLVGDAVLGVIQ